jgi:hypothetical protein
MDRGEYVVEVRSQAVRHGNDRERDAGRDPTVFNAVAPPSSSKSA